MSTVRYQVLVISHGPHSIASIPDLGCEAVGISEAAAVVAVREKALRRLRSYDGGVVDPPRPSRLTLAPIELPAPAGRCSSRRAGLGVVPDVAGLPPQQRGFGTVGIDR
jgi:hypothetical protein